MERHCADPNSYAFEDFDGHTTYPKDAQQSSEVLWSKISKSHLPVWVLALFQNVRGIIVVTDSDSVMWRFESPYRHLESEIDKILSYTKNGNLLVHRTYYSESV